MTAITSGLTVTDTSVPPGTNRLIRSASPYLLQHSRNPVDWFEWGEEAFTAARERNVPILLSIGYATCHWCHVMAHESFEDLETARLLNEHFVCIKVDREERPDIDSCYMTVSQILTGSGGWPLNIFMTAEREPFFSVTYLPKHPGRGMTGFMDLIANISAIFRQRPDLVRSNCSSIAAQMRSITSLAASGLPDANALGEMALEELGAIYDTRYGGFGKANKFPMPPTLSWLLTQGDDARQMALHTLTMILRGGIRDHLGGGFHRYSVDRRWLVPHFEKMLYDQAMIISACLDAHEQTSDIRFLNASLETARFVGRELTSPEGAFYSALDADSEGAEGTFYLWDGDEVEELLGRETELFGAFYGISAQGNFEGRNILNISMEPADFARDAGIDLSVLESRLADCRRLLLERRETRVRPFRDEKVLVSWNGLMIAALSRLGTVSGNDIFTGYAENTADFILKNLVNHDGRLLRSFFSGKASPVPAFLEDYAFLCNGLLLLADASGNEAWLEMARGLASKMVLLFRRDDGRFGTSGNDAEKMPFEGMPDHDGVIPSGLSMAARVLIGTGIRFNDEILLEAGRGILLQLAPAMQKHPSSHLEALRALELFNSTGHSS